MENNEETGLDDVTYLCGHCLDNVPRTLNEFYFHDCTKFQLNVTILHEKFVFRNGTDHSEYLYRCGECGTMIFRRLKDYKRHKCTQNYSGFKIIGEHVCDSTKVIVVQVQQEDPVVQKQQQQQQQQQQQPVQPDQQIQPAGPIQQQQQQQGGQTQQQQQQPVQPEQQIQPAGPIQQQRHPTVQTQQQQQQLVRPDQQIQQQQQQAGQTQQQHDSSHMSSSSAGKEANQRIDWTTDMVKLLLVTFKNIREGLQDQTNFSKNHINREIVKVLANHGYQVKETQVKSKLQLLEKSYKKKMENKGPKQSGRNRMNVANENELHEAFAKQHNINPPQLIGPDWEIHNKEVDTELVNEDAVLVDNVEANNLENIPMETQDTQTTPPRSDTSTDGGNNSATHSGQSANKRGAEELDSTDKRKKYTLQLRLSEKEAAQIRHKESMEMKKVYCELKREEIKMKKEKNDKQLAITEEFMREKNDLKKRN